MQCHSRSWRQQCTRKNPVKSCLNTLGKKLHRKNLLQRCLNTPWTTLHRLNKSLCNFVLEAPENTKQEKFCSLLSYYLWSNIAQIKTLCNVVWEATDNIPQEKILCNVASILLGQYYTGKTCKTIWEAPDNIIQEKILCNVFWTPSGHFPAIFILVQLIF